MNDKYYFNPQICAPVLDYTMALNASSTTLYIQQPQQKQSESALQRWQQHLLNTRLAQQRH